MYRRFYDYIKGARRRGYAFELPLEVFAHLTSQPCHYCAKMRGDRSGIDRVDNSFGYVAGNCVPCCWACNRFKGADLSPAEMAEIARDIYLASVKSTTL